MPKSSALFAVCFVAGMLAAVISALFVWLCNKWGITTFLNIQISQTFKLSALYPQIFTGGLWGLLYFFTVGIPRHRRHWIRKGLWFSLIPSLVTLFYLYPQVYHKGLAALDLGMFAPLLIVTTYLIWGFSIGFFTRLLWGR